MYRKAKNLVNIGLLILSGAVYALTMVYLLGRFGFLLGILISGAVFLLMAFIYINLFKYLSRKLFKRIILSGFNRRLNDFYEKVRVSFTINDFLDIIHQVLENQADFSVVWLNGNTFSTIYHSPQHISSDPKSIEKLMKTYKDDNEGMYFIDRSLELADNPKNAYGILYHYQGYLFFMLSNYLDVYDPDLFRNIDNEFKSFVNRLETIERMFSLSSISQEWKLLAETQQSFLPEKIPDVAGLEVSVHYQALVNVSGDYYDVIRIDEERSLFVLGDVSGKGLSAALIMGIIMNTVKIIEDKTDIVSVINSVDEAIKNMGFDGKFTALFLGMYHRGTGVLTYVNAGIPEPWVVSKGVIKLVSANLPLIGIMDLGEIKTETMQLYPDDVLIIGSDGVYEAEDADHNQLGDTQYYKDTILKSVSGSADQISEDIIRMITEFSRDGKIRDDIALLVVKVRGEA